MHAIVLAAGFGRRMRPLSDVTHKALLPIGSTTILGRILDALDTPAITDILVVTGYRADDIERFVASRPAAGPPVRFVHNDRFETTNNIVSLAMALDAIAIDGDVVLVECDLLFDAAVLRRLLAGPAGNTALVDHYRAGMDGTVVAVRDGLVAHVYPPHLQGEDFVYADKFKTLNIYRFDRDFCRDVFHPLLSSYARHVDGNCYYELVLGMLVNMQRQRVRAEVVAHDAWAEVDDPNDLAGARFLFEADRRAAVLDRTLGGHWNFDLLDFAFMRNARFPTDAMVAAMRQALPDLLRSYGSTQAVLNEKLAWFLLCKPERVQVLHGLSQIYPMLPRLLGPGSVHLPAPTFGEYARWLPDHHAYVDAPGVDVGDLESRAAAGGTLVVVNPNNPSGTTVSMRSVHRLAAAHPTTRIVVDESFVDFSHEPSMVSLLEADPLPNIVVLKSLGKFLGVPGLRLGFVYSTDLALIAQVGAELPVWNLGAPAEYYLELLLKYRNELAASLTATREDRAALAADLRAVPLVADVLEGGGNFLLVKLEGHDASLAARIRSRLLADYAIDVKDVSARFTPARPRLRIGVRLPHENARLTEALAGVARAVAGELS